MKPKDCIYTRCQTPFFFPFKMSCVESSKVGLANLGNTCFMNVILQALRLSPPLVVSCLASNPPALRAKSKKTAIVTAFHQLIRDFWKIAPKDSEIPTLIPRGFLHALITVLRETDDDWYHHGQQADAAEALGYMLDSLHDGIYRRVRMDIVGDAHTQEEESHIKAIRAWGSFFSKEYSSVIQNFYGQTQICVKCSVCGSVSERYEPWSMLKAPIPGSDVAGSPVPSLDDCIAASFSQQTVLDDYHCDTCKTKVKASLTEKISRLPPICIVALKRFTNSGRKVRGKVEWNLDSTDYAPHMAFRRDPFADKPIDTEYMTYAVIEHQGSTHGGHYHMYARQGLTAWMGYDDSSVTTVRPENILTADSYIAFMISKKEYGAMLEKMEQAIQTLRTSEISQTV